MKRCTSLAAALLLVVGLSTAQAQQTLYWDLDSSTPGPGGPAPTGNWDLGSGNWTTDSAGAIDTTGITWAANDHAIFSAGTEGVDDATGAYAITAGAGVEPASITIDDGRVVLGGTALNMSATDTVRINQGAIMQIPGQAQVVTATGHVITFDGGELRNTQGGVVSNVYGQGAGPPIGRLTANGGTINVPKGGAGQYGIYNWIGSFDLDTGVTAATLTKKGGSETRLRNTNTFTTLDVQEGLLRVDGTLGTDLSLGAANGTVILRGGASPNTTSGVALGTTANLTAAGVGATPATRSIVLDTTNGQDSMFVLNAPWDINGNISGPGGLMLNGWAREDTGAIIGTSQNLGLGGTNTYAGDTTINFGTIVASGGNAIPDTSNVIISTTTTWGLTTTLNTATLQINASETIREITGGTHTANGDAANRGNMALNGAAVVLTLGHAGDFTYSGGASGTGGFTKVGAGTMTIRHYDYTNSGPTTISQGKIVLGTSTAGLGLSSTVTINAGAEWDMATFNDTIGNLAGNGLVSNGGNLSLNNTANASFGGTMALSGFFRKNAASTGTSTITSSISANEIRAEGGTLVLGNSNTVATSVTVGGGKLLANNASGSATGAAPIGVTSGTLGGTGSVAGAVTVGGTGHIAPGPATGIESLGMTGGLTLNSGSILDFELAAPGTSDLINSTLAGGTNILGATLNLTDAGGLAAGTYTLIDYAGALLGDESNITFGTVPSGFSYALVDTGSVINLSVTAAATNDADFNGDGAIDAADYVVWRKFNPIATGATQATGDADGDGDNDGDDYRDDVDNTGWYNTYGEPSPGSGGGGAVPEPSTLALLAIGLAAFAGRRRS